MSSMGRLHPDAAGMKQAGRAHKSDDISLPPIPNVYAAVLSRKDLLFLSPPSRSTRTLQAHRTLATHILMATPASPETAYGNSGTKHRFGPARRRS